MSVDVKRYVQKCLEMAIEELNLCPVVNGEIDPYTDIYGAKAIAHVIAGVNLERANAVIRRAALYMDLPHPHGRRVTGENDFAAIRLASLLYQGYDKLEDETKRLVKRFFLEKDFTSEYGSENHFLMMHSARYLAAQFYCDDTFVQYGKTSKEVLEIDKKWLIDFLSWRAKYGFGEFCSSGYLHEDYMMVAMLDCFVKDAELKTTAHMLVNLIALELLNSTDLFGYPIGARGRSYPGPYTSTERLWAVKMFIEQQPSADLNIIFAPAFPDKWVLDTYTERKYPCEVYERKNLHSMYAWTGDNPDWEKLETINKNGSISKYTYMCNDYSVGAINHQADYPKEYIYDAGYAHHQQVEWSLWLTDKLVKNSTKIFTSHPGKTGEHNVWTGDLGCCCNNSYATKDTCLTIYNIEKETELDYTHMFYEPGKYDAIDFEDNRIFFEKGNCYVYVYVAKPYTREIEETCNAREIKSVGRKNAWAVRVGLKQDYSSYEDFKNKMRAIKVSFDEENMVFTFDNLTIDRNKNNSIDGKLNNYPYDKVYDTPWVKSDWDNGIVEVISGEKTYVMDFDNIKIYVK